MKAYKGFNSKLQCKPGEKIFQYEIGKTYEEATADLCNSGFHACEFPLDVFGYYPPSDCRYCVVDLEEVSDKKDDDSKLCGKKIHIEAEIGLKGIIEAGVKFILEKSKDNKSNTGDWSAATNTGDWSAATNTGNRSAATNTGDWSAATNTGYCSAATNTGNRSAATNTGYCSAATVSGNNSVAIVTGYQSKAKASIGSWIVLTERNDKYEILTVKAFKVDGDVINPDCYYMLQNGEPVKVE